MSLLSVEAINSYYGDSHILFDVSLRVEQNEVVALLGRNGAGKSTTLKTIVGLVSKREGEIRFQGRAIGGLPTPRIAHLGIGYVPEERRIFPNMTAEENLRVTRRFSQGRDPWTLKRVYAVFPKLAELRGRTAGLLSGGEQQMLCIARTLMGGPKLLLLDEPSEGLAPVVLQELARQIRALKQAGVTLLLAEQNVAFAESVSDRVAVIDRGVTEFQSTFAELHRDEQRKQRHLFVEARPAAGGRIS